MTAGELQAQLRQDPGYFQRRRQEQLREEEARRAYAEAAAPVVADLRAAGIDVDCPTELLPEDAPELERAAPILLEWLGRVDYDPLKETLVRSLTTPRVRPAAAPALIREFRSPHHSHNVRWAIGNALEVVADASVEDEVIELARDRRYGTARQMVVLGLARVKTEKAVRAALDLLDDPDVEVYAAMALGKLRVKEARPAIERLAQHEDSWVRERMRRALARIDRPPKAGR